jgi:DNA replication protein DnaC
MTTEWITVRPQDLWPHYTGADQYPPLDDGEEALRLFDSARFFDTAHRLAPPMYRNAWEMPVPLHRWVTERIEGNAMLFGPPGRGKTHAAVAAGCLLSGLDLAGFAFISTYRWLSEIKNFRDPEAAEEARARAELAHVLVIDDIGRANVTDYDIENLAQLLDERLDRRRRTIMTSNLLAEEFADVFGDHLTSRLLWQAEEILVDGVDRRAKGN